MTLLTPDAPLFANQPITAGGSYQTLGPFDVGGFDNATIYLQAINNLIGFTDSCGVTAVYVDENGKTLFTQLVAVVRVAALPGGGETLLVRFRLLGARVSFQFGGYPTPVVGTEATVTVVCSNRPMPHDGPYTPSAAGTIITAGTTASIAQFVAEDHTITGYCGPARLYARGTLAGDSSCIALLVDDNTAKEIEGAGIVAGNAGGPWNSTQSPEIQIPSTSTTLRLTNLAANPQTIKYSLVAN